jgi:hypothetical protein
MELTHLTKILLVPLSSAVATTAMAMMTRASSSSLKGVDPPSSKKGYSRAFLLVSSRYMCVLTLLFAPIFVLEHKKVIFGSRKCTSTTLNINWDLMVCSPGLSLPGRRPRHHDINPWVLG